MSRSCISQSVNEFSSLDAIIYSNNKTITDELTTMSKDVSFEYLGRDTFKGLEVEYFFINDKKKSVVCNYSKFFIDSISSIDRYSSLRELFAQSRKNYYCLNSHFPILYDCFFLPSDTFYYCNEKDIAEDRYMDRLIYKISENEFILLSRVLVLADVFKSNQLKYAKYYYHFLDDTSSLKEIKRIHYREVISRMPIKENEIFSVIGKKYNENEFSKSCISYFK